MKRSFIVVLAAALLGLSACSTGQVVGTGAGAAGGYAVDGKRGAVIGGVGGGLLGGILD
jgi:osmotically inducible lipoprotein OsmB